MHLAELSAAEQRVLGCLIEKRWTTPEQYPLSLNSLRLACNQLTNRDPVTDYDEATVREAAQRLSRYGLTRLASGHGSRSVKYRHLAEEALGLGREELAVLAVLLLRGPQTPGELKARTERMASLGSLSDVERVLASLGERGYARRLDRRPGQKEDRYEQLLGSGPVPSAGAEPGAVPGAEPGVAGAEPGAVPRAEPGVAGAEPGAVPRAEPGVAGAEPGAVPASPNGAPLESLQSRVQALEAEVAALRQELAALQLSIASPTT